MAAAAAPTSRPRQRSKMKPAEIADMLRPLVTKKSWIKYVQSPAEKLDIHAMVKCDRIVAHMATRQPNLSFARRGMREGLTMILDEHLASGTWGMTKEQGADWVVDIEQRLRTLCRHFQQAMLRKPRPSWLRRMPSATGLAAPRDSAAGDNGDESPLGDGSAADGGASVPDDDLFRDNEALKGGCDWVVPHYEESSDDGGEPRKNYFFGWCPELRKAYRVEVGKTHREYTDMPLLAPASSADHDPMVAEWPDGSRAAIAGITLGRHTALADQRQGAAKPSRFKREYRHKATTHKIVVDKRADRGLLMSVWEQGKQILQIPVKRFGDETTEAAQDAAFSLMDKIAQQYANDEVPRTELYKLRDLEMKKFAVDAHGPRTTAMAKQAKPKGAKQAIDDVADAHLGEEQRREASSPSASPPRAAASIGPSVKRRICAKTAPTVVAVASSASDVGVEAACKKFRDTMPPIPQDWECEMRVELGRSGLL
jgi:hypothetical protein